MEEFVSADPAISYGENSCCHSSVRIVYDLKITDFDRKCDGNI